MYVYASGVRIEGVIRRGDSLFLGNGGREIISYISKCPT